MKKNEIKIGLSKDNMLILLYHKVDFNLARSKLTLDVLKKISYRKLSTLCNIKDIDTPFYYSETSKKLFYIRIGLVSEVKEVKFNNKIIFSS